MTELTGEKKEHGAQVVLTGEARAAARGGIADSLAGNVEHKRRLEIVGEVADGNSDDGTSVTGKRQPDDVLAEKTDAPNGPTADVHPEEGSTVYDAGGLGGTPTTPPPDNVTSDK